jgi:uncharacterized protein (DUF697 family)
MPKNEESKLNIPVKIDALTRAKVEEIVKKHSWIAAGLGIVPVPVFNFVSVTAVQISMAQALTRVYDIEVKKSWIKNIISSVLGALATTGVGVTAGGAALGVPLVGLSLSSLTAPALNGVTTYAVGYMFIRYFESPDGILKTNVKALAGWFKEGFKQGREKLGGAIAGKSEAAEPAGVVI